MPNGTSIRPSIPSKKNRGRKLATMISVLFRIGIRTSLEALNTISLMGRRFSGGSVRFSRRCRNTFSTSTMASSTNDPIAMAIPPMLMVLMVSPIRFMTRMVMSKDIGMVTKEIMVVRAFIRNMNNTITTKNAPSKSDRWMLPMELLMKELWRKICLSMCTSPGNSFLRLSSIWSSFSVSSRVLTFGCLVTVISTAGVARWEAIPVLGDWAPIFKSAISFNRTGVPSVCLITVCASSSM